MATKKISVDDLEVGMYVTRLDRPWRETEFVFQGFEVSDQAMIEDIKMQTKHVYILTRDEPVKSESKFDSPDLDIEMAQIKSPVDKPTTPIENELRLAAESYRDIGEMLQQIESALKSSTSLNVPRIRATLRKMVQSIERNPDAYIWLARTKHYGSKAFRQFLRTSVWASVLARQLDLDEDAMIDVSMGVLLMDVGFAKVPGSILTKKSRLTDEEWKEVKTHVRHSTEMLKSTEDIPNSVIRLIETHHERMDGSGYPKGLEGNAVPLTGQIAGIVDCFSAVTRWRPFKEPMSSSAALQLLYRQREAWFSETLVDNFIHALGAYPTGSLVELNSGEVGIVSSQNLGRRLRPRIILFLDTDKNPFESYPKKNLLENLNVSKDHTVNIVSSLPDGAYGIDVDQLKF